MARAWFAFVVKFCISLMLSSFFRHSQQGIVYTRYFENSCTIRELVGEYFNVVSTSTSVVEGL